MPTDHNQRRVFEFLVNHLETGVEFSPHDLEAVTNWQGTTFPTYWSKQLHTLVKEVDADANTYRVSEAFRRYSTWQKFRQHVTQVRGASTHYDKLEYGIVRIYEFFMPLTNEPYLRGALDALFFKDTIESRLKTISEAELLQAFPKEANESDKEHIERRWAWLSGKFGGYSIYHVNGRFRAQELATRSELGNSISQYLIDETTAVTRFIFPCTSEQEAEQVEFFFTTLFVQAIIEVVNGEDAIWMVETGWKNRLHIWQVADS